MRRAISLFIVMAFLSSCVMPRQGYAQSLLNLPQPGEMIGLSESFMPVVLKGMSIHPENPFLFDFIVDNGNTDLKGQALTDETTKLVKYFLAGLAVPEKELWVNLSPVEKDRIMADQLSHTDAGRDMLGQDYILKQITSTLMYPEKDLGRKFWDEIYSRVYTKFGNTQVPVDTFNKVWITPDVAEVYQHEGNAFVTKAHLKVMLETDYQAAQSQDASRGGSVTRPIDMSSSNDIQAQELSRQVIREIIIPVLENEVNEGRNFAPLRQIFHSLILAGWYKNALKNSLLNQVYAGTNKVDGINTADKNVKAQVYAQYLQAYQKGVYNYVKDEFDHTTQQTLPRKYFSGGIAGFFSPKIRFIKDVWIALQLERWNLRKISYEFLTIKQDWFDGSIADENALKEALLQTIFSPEALVVDKRAAYRTLRAIGHHLYAGDFRWLEVPLAQNDSWAMAFKIVALAPQAPPLTHWEVTGLLIGVKTSFLRVRDNVWGKAAIARLIQRPPVMVPGETFRKEEAELRQVLREYREPVVTMAVSVVNMFLWHGDTGARALDKTLEIFQWFVQPLDFLHGGEAAARLMIEYPQKRAQEAVGLVLKLQKQTGGKWSEVKKIIFNVDSRRGPYAQEIAWWGKRGSSELVMKELPVQGGIDLGQGDYLKVVGTDAAGLPQFDPAQLMQFQKDLRGFVPVPAGFPQPVNIRPLMGFDPAGAEAVVTQM